MKNLVKKVAKNKNGITLMALVVTIIILLILAGISIGMLSGDNSIIKQAGNAKTQTDIAQEKEILEQATVVAMGKSKYGDIDETYFTNELEKNNATVSKSGSKYKVTFTSGRQYTVDQDGNAKEKNPNALEISELNENASTYFGWDIINYAETLPTNLQDTQWQLFYAGALDGETEERIYLISKGYVKNTDLPAKNGATPIIYNINNNVLAYFSTNKSTPDDGVIPHYTGTIDIAEIKLQKLNKKYFSWLATNNKTSTSNGKKALAYMLDINIWNSFSGSYAEYTIGGPTIELLFTAYNRYKNKTSGETYETNVNSITGYQISKDGGSNYAKSYSGIIENSDKPYSAYRIGSASGYWIASPGDNGFDSVMSVNDSGLVSCEHYSGVNRGFRPVILLDSRYTLEKTKDSNGNDAFKIVEQ